MCIRDSSYTAYGEQMGSVKAGGFTYNAEAYDAATGMLNLRARQYEPAVGRFGQKDIYPANLLIPQSFNAYLFTYNSPVGFVDGDGLTAKSLGSVLSSCLLYTSLATAYEYDAMGNVLSVMQGLSLIHI